MSHINRISHSKKNADRYSTPFSRVFPPPPQLSGLAWMLLYPNHHDASQIATCFITTQQITF